MLQQLDEGRLDDAKHMLHLELDREILAVDSLLDSADDRSRELARKVFTGIARRRAEHPERYEGQLAKADSGVTARIDSILSRVVERSPRK